MENLDTISVMNASARLAKRDKITRRGFLGVGSAALAATGMVPVLSLWEWFAHTPPGLVIAHLRIDKATFDAIPKNEFVVLKDYHL
jgi:hypothetical protein